MDHSRHRHHYCIVCYSKVITSKSADSPKQFGYPLNERISKHFPEDTYPRVKTVTHRQRVKTRALDSVHKRCLAARYVQQKLEGAGGGLSSNEVTTHSYSFTFFSMMLIFFIIVIIIITLSPSTPSTPSSTYQPDSVQSCLHAVLVLLCYSVFVSNILMFGETGVSGEYIMLHITNAIIRFILVNFIIIIIIVVVVVVVIVTTVTTIFTIVTTR
jgi:hypothetical protein